MESCSHGSCRHIWEFVHFCTVADKQCPICAQIFPTGLVCRKQRLQTYPQRNSATRPARREKCLSANTPKLQNARNLRQSAAPTASIVLCTLVSLPKQFLNQLDFGSNTRFSLPYDRCHCPESSCDSNVKWPAILFSSNAQSSIIRRYSRSAFHYFVQMS
jgi:hypothetical protein